MCDEVPSAGAWQTSKRANHSTGIADGQDVGRQAIYYDTACAYYGVLANCHPRANDNSAAEPDTITDKDRHSIFQGRVGGLVGIEGGVIS